MCERDLDKNGKSWLRGDIFEIADSRSFAFTTIVDAGVYIVDRHYKFDIQLFHDHAWRMSTFKKWSNPYQFLTKTETLNIMSFVT